MTNARKKESYFTNLDELIARVCEAADEWKVLCHLENRLDCTEDNSSDFECLVRTVKFSLQLCAMQGILPFGIIADLLAYR